MMTATKRSRALAAQRIAAGQVVAKEDAARVIQAGIRGALWRRRVKREADQELMFIGMKPQVGAAALWDAQDMQHGLWQPSILVCALLNQEAAVKQH